MRHLNQLQIILYWSRLSYLNTSIKSVPTKIYAAFTSNRILKKHAHNKARAFYPLPHQEERLSPITPLRECTEIEKCDIIKR